MGMEALYYTQESKMVAIILAAGKGTRMKSNLPKALHPICGKPLTRYVIDACRESGIEECIVVIGHGAEEVQAALGNDVKYAVQQEQRGTGDACRAALGLLDGCEGSVMVLAGDVPLLDPAALRELAEEQAASGMAATMLTTVLPDGGHYGRVIRAADDTVEKIVEAKDATPSELAVGEINAAIYCFNLPLLRKYIDELTPANAQGEYYLTDVIGLMVADGHKVGAKISADPNIVLGVNNRVDLSYLTDVVRRKILDRLMLSGITVIDPSTTYVDEDVEVGMDTVLHPMTVLEKGCKIGKNCIIGPSSRLAGAVVEDGAEVLFSNIVESTVGEGCKIGPFAHIRPGCTLGKNVKLGNFVEAKNSEIEESVSVGHLSYIGDTRIGRRTNIGAGTITCNYDGYKKHHTEIGQDAFVGSNNTLVAPVKVGDGSLTAAGSVITRDVPADSLAIARSEEVIKIGWARRRREQKDTQ